MGLAGVNSINWGRIMAQVVYYFTAAVALGAPGRSVSFAVPTGNFGDIFAGFVAKRMGLPIAELLIATNENDILHRTMKTGRYEMRGVSATISPSMDIQISSNFERLLYEVLGRDAQAVGRLMDGLKQSGAFNIDEASLAALRNGFSSGSCNETETIATIAAAKRDYGMTIDPHTAVALHVAAQVERDPKVPMVVLSTAHPAKFPAAIEAALGAPPTEPKVVASQRGLPERQQTLANEIEDVKQFIKDSSRAAEPCQ